MSTGEFPCQGSCTCGAVRYQIESEPLFVHCCHCYWCQRESGSTFALNAMIEADRVTLLNGSPIAVEVSSNSGKGQRIWRCKDCQIALWSNYAGAGDSIHFVRVGTLDEPCALSPDIHIYTASKQEWVMIPDGVPQFEGYYRRSECWPQEKLQRLSQLQKA